MRRIKNWIKEDFYYILFIVIIFVVCNFKLPYYIMAPGGVINMNNRIKLEDKFETKGTLDLLYVSEHDGTIGSILLSFLFKDWDLNKIEEMQINKESMKEIEIRNKVMLDNSRQNAIMVAYNKALKNVKINGSENIVIATTKENNLKIGDIILKANGIEVKDVSQLKTIISGSDNNINLIIKRNNKQEEVAVPVEEKDGIKQIGIVVVTNYDYELDPDIKIDFKNSEGGSSGGLMIALNIYNSLVEDDITKGKKIAGTGTIDLNGNVGEIDGVKYKIIGAYKNKMELVFVPKDNYDEAIKVVKDRNYKMKVVGVSTFDEALDYLLENYKN